mmetsp:Transcript_16294/g.20640  ORF Transcript_16294/g.20640 Transcript_16294/m.20640 type:complete len:88 (-) Transcript_16294:276-539(-)
MLHDAIEFIINLLVNLINGLGQVGFNAPIIELISTQLLLLQLLDGLAHAINLALLFLFFKMDVFINMLHSLSLILEHLLHLIENCGD